MDVSRLPVKYHDYSPEGACRELFRNKSHELIISGPAGTGKSRACLEKVHWILEKYRRIRVLMIRKTRRSMTQSCIVTYEQEVLPRPDYIPFHGGDQEYRYPTGSIFAIAGLDDPQKIYSSQWDIIYVNQCEELSEEEWTQVRSRNRNYVMPYQQLLGDCNPGPPQHWILSRRAQGLCTVLESRHEDNPVYWDKEKQEWTDKGRDYVFGTLDALPGALKQRLRYGKWASAEGAVYQDSWDRAHHVIPRFFKDVPLTEDQVPKDWPRIWSIDFGYKNPFVWQAWAKDPDGRLFLYKQIYMTNRIVSDHAKQIKEVTKNDPKPIAIICDTDAEDRATFERELGWQTKGAWKAVSVGIQGVEARLRKAGDGKARLFFLEESLIEIDQTLLAAKKPTRTEDEFEVYVWETSSGRRKGEEPKKENDHGCFVAGTLITTKRGLVPIERVTTSDQVLTRSGFKNVFDCGMTSANADVFELRFENGTSIVGTSNHPIGTLDGFVPLTNLKENSECLGLNHSHQTKKEDRASSSMMLSSLLCHETAKRDTLDLANSLFSWGINEEKVWLVLFGSTIAVLYLQNYTFITKMMILQMIVFQILSCLLIRNIRSATKLLKSNKEKRTWFCMVQRCVQRLRSGISHLKGVRGIQLTLKLSTRIVSWSQRFVKFVEKVTQRFLNIKDFVQALVGLLHDALQVLISSSLNVQFANVNFSTTKISNVYSVQDSVRKLQESLERKSNAMDAGKFLSPDLVKKENSAPLRVYTVTGAPTYKGSAPVFNLTIEDTHEYFANGVLVHNCDAARYCVAHVDELNKRTMPMFQMGSITKSGSGGNTAGYGMTRPSGFRMPSNAPSKFGGNQ